MNIKSVYGDLPEVVYEPTYGLTSLNLREIWDYRELLYFLTWRDIKVRYKQAALGLTWAILQPVMTMIVFSIVFGKFAKLPSDGIPYSVFSFTALLPWQLFAGALERAGTSLVGNSNLITKIYFPRLVIPISAVASALIDFAVSFIVLLALMIYFRISPTWAIFTIPFFVLLSMVTALAVSLWLSALNVQYRDVQYMIPFLIQIWMYASPIAYSESLIQGTLWRFIYNLNPMVSVIQGFRWAMLGGPPPNNLMFVSIGMVLILLVLGVNYFKRMEETFADIV